MRRHPSASYSFRPRLERLETRDLPSTAGLLVSGLVQPLPQLTQQMSGLVQQMNADFNHLKTDVAAETDPFPDSLSNTISNDYTKVANDFGQIQALNTVLTSAAQVDRAAIFLGMANGLFDASDLLSLSQAMKTIKNTTSTSANDLAQATLLANTNPGNGFPTINSELHP